MTGSAEREMKLNLLKEYGSPATLAFLPRSLTDRFNPAYNNATDWQGLFYANGSIKNVDADISAASKAFNYRVGLNYYDELLRRLDFNVLVSGEILISKSVQN